MSAQLHDQLLFRLVRQQLYVSDRTPNERPNPLRSRFVHARHLHGDAGLFPRVEKFESDASDAGFGMERSFAVGHAAVIQVVDEKLVRVVKVCIASSEDRETSIVESFDEERMTQLLAHVDRFDDQNELGRMSEHRVQSGYQPPFLRS